MKKVLITSLFTFSTFAADWALAQNLICWEEALYIQATGAESAHQQLSPMVTHWQCNQMRSFLSLLPQASEKIRAWTQAAKNDQLKVPPFFHSGEANEEIGFSWKKCEVKEDFYHLTKNENGFIVPECTPDTLYSWSGFDKAQWFWENLKEGKNWRGPLSRSLFTVSNPVGSFGYGPLPLRFKLKKGTKAKYARNTLYNSCEAFLQAGFLSQQEMADTVIARFVEWNNGSGNNLMEYIICSADVIDSWSFLTPESFDEIIIDTKWKQEKHYYQWESYAKQYGTDIFYDLIVDSLLGANFTKRNLDNKMQLLGILTDRGFGQVIRRDIKTPTEDHFKTAIPIYFNPRGF